MSDFCRNSRRFLKSASAHIISAGVYQTARAETMFKFVQCILYTKTHSDSIKTSALSPTSPITSKKKTAHFIPTSPATYSVNPILHMLARSHQTSQERNNQSASHRHNILRYKPDSGAHLSRNTDGQLGVEVGILLGPTVVDE